MTDHQPYHFEQEGDALFLVPGLVITAAPDLELHIQTSYGETGSGGKGRLIIRAVHKEAAHT